LRNWRTFNWAKSDDITSIIGKLNTCQSQETRVIKSLSVKRAVGLNVCKVTVHVEAQCRHPIDSHQNLRSLRISVNHLKWNNWEEKRVTIVTQSLYLWLHIEISSQWSKIFAFVASNHAWLHLEVDTGEVKSKVNMVMWEIIRCIVIILIVKIIN
jgi:hypothetical protein